jgi:hypothetical protein
MANRLKRLLGFRRITRLRGVLNRVTRGRVGLYSTAEHYSSGPSAKVLRYYQYDGTREIACQQCGWKGSGETASIELRGDLMEVCCPSCGRMLLVVGYPTVEDTKTAAAAGDERAVRELDHALRVERFHQRHEREALRDPSQLPPLDGDELIFRWESEGEDDDRRTVVRVGGRELWSEPEIWEGIDRFVEVFEMLRVRYGEQFGFLLPTPASELYLYGDDLSARSKAIMRQFPELDGERLELETSYESDELGGPHLHVRHAGKLVWRELDAPMRPDLWRIRSLEEFLRGPYGDRFRLHLPPEEEIVFGGYFPDLPGERLEFEYSLASRPKDRRRTIILHDGREIWRDPSERAFVGRDHAESLLRARYGDRFASLTEREERGE